MIKSRAEATTFRIFIIIVLKFATIVQPQMPQKVVGLAVIFGTRLETAIHPHNNDTSHRSQQPPLATPKVPLNANKSSNSSTAAT